MIKLNYSLPPMTSLKNGLSELSGKELHLDDIVIKQVEPTDNEKIYQVTFSPIDNHPKWFDTITRKYYRVDFFDIGELNKGKVLRGPFLSLTNNMVVLSEALHTGFGISLPPENLEVGTTDYVNGKIEVIVKDAITIFGSAILDFIEHKININDVIEYDDVGMFEI